ncbi:MAG: glycoside hydrolase family 5 protein [Solirubrobacterales bacterium]|nr:glycoside hydrolase family 5 protein [Solirubrobacterales bacterium]
MHERVHRATAALALALCVLAWLPAAGEARASKAAPASSALLAGVNIPGVGDISNLAQADSTIAHARALHAKVVRTEVPWSVLEPQQGQIEPSAQAFTDRLVDDAAAAHIGVIMVVDSTPCWASSAPTPLLEGCNPLADGAAQSWPPSDPAAYAAFVAYLARRYGPHLAALEVWNEPDQSNEAYFAGPDKAERYAAVLRAAYPAIKAADPSVPVLAGSLVGSNGAFLRLLYAAGIKGYYDGLSVHFYTLTLGSLRSIREAQLAAGDTKPLWLDEFGWTSCWPRERIEQEQGCVTQRIQARNLSDTLRTLARSPFVAAAVAYKLQDSPREDFGMLSTSAGRKPSFAAFSSAVTSPFGSISPVTLKLRRKGSHVLATGSGPVGDFMRLEVFRGKLLRYWVVFTLNRFDEYSVTLPASLGTRGLRVRVFQYWSGPAKAAQKTI